MPPKFSQLALSIETLDISELSLEEVTSRLKVAEDRLELQEPSREHGRLLLTEQQWLEKMKVCQGSNSSRPMRGCAHDDDLSGRRVEKVATIA